jgi:hypothetical protein
MTIDAEVAIKAIAPPVDLEHQLRTRRTQAFRLCFVAVLLAIAALVLWFGKWSA